MHFEPCRALAYPPPLPRRAAAQFGCSFGEGSYISERLYLLSRSKSGPTTLIPQRPCACRQHSRFPPGAKLWSNASEKHAL